MMKYFIAIITLSFLVSCGQNNIIQQGDRQESLSQDSIAILNDPKNYLNIQTHTFSEIDSSGVLMFPLSMGETERSGARFSYKEMPMNGYWNIIFYNSKTKEYHLLSDRKMIIVNYDYKYESSNQNNISQTSRYIFYTVRTDDFNKDKKLTEEDPSYLFYSDKFGKNFKRISPIGCSLNTWKFINSSNTVILTARKDSNKNRKFDNSDEITSFEIELDKKTEPKEIFIEDFKNKLKILFDRDWKRLKK